MTINSSYSSNLSGLALAKLPDPAQAKQARTLAQAVSKLNSSPSIPENRELSMSIDPKTKIPVVRVLDATTHEVLDQLPAEYVLRVTAFLEAQEAQDSLSNISSLIR